MSDSTIRERILRAFGDADVVEASVLGGKGFFVDDRMVVALTDGYLCLLCDDESLMTGPGVSPYEFAGRAVPGWVSIDGDVLDDAQLSSWIERGLALLNPTTP